MPQRYFQVGFNRCGTTAIAEMLQGIGLNAVHHVYWKDDEQRNLARDITANLSAGRMPLAGMDAIQVFTDVEYVSDTEIIQGNRLFREIMSSYPGMRFILNIRDRDAWVKSRLNFPNYLSRYMAHTGLDEAGVIALWEQEWDTHIAEVQAEIQPNRLLVLDIDSPDFEAIDAFFGPGTSKHLRQRNKSVSGPLAQKAQKLLPGWVVRMAPNSLKNILKDY